MRNSGLLYSINSFRFDFSKSLSVDDCTRSSLSSSLLSFNNAISFAADNLFFNSFSAAIDYITRLCAIYSDDVLKYTLSHTTCNSKDSRFIAPLDFVVYVS